MAAITNRMQVLQNHLNQPEAKLRPIITFINGDVAWLISFPRPISDKNANGKVYYHAAIDPWFGEPSQVLTSYVLEIHLGEDPGIPSRAALDAAILEIELAAGNSLVLSSADPALDAIFIAHIGEHCMKESLLQLSASTPIFSVAASASYIASWSHFNTVVPMSSYDPSKTPWKEGHLGSPLPTWLTVFPLTMRRLNNPGLAIITSASETENELILMAPHGIAADESCIKGLVTSVKMLALLAPLNDEYAFGVQQILGVKDGLAIVQAAGTKYYVRNGDITPLKFSGFISWFINNISHDLQWGVDELRKELGDEKVIEQPTLITVENGGSYVLV